MLYKHIPQFPDGSIWFDAAYQLNYDMKPTYTLNVCAKDVLLVEVCDDLTISVLDLPNVPVWQSLPETVTIPEDTPIGTVLTRCVALDADFGDIITYAIKSTVPMAAPISLDSISQ